MLHQSESGCVIIPRGGGVVPLYCIVGGHSLDDIYKWQRGGQELAGNTPVFWIKEPGLYSCTVTRSGLSCKSLTIQVVTKAQGRSYGKCLSLLLIIIIISILCPYCMLHQMIPPWRTGLLKVEEMNMTLDVSYALIYNAYSIICVCVCVYRSRR